MEIWQFALRYGNSNDPRNGACLLDAVSWFEYGTLGDHPLCVCPVIASFARAVNDLLSDDRRQELKRFILRLPGTVDPSAEQERATFLMWQAVHIFVPLALEAAALCALGEHAPILRLHAGKLRGQSEAAEAISAVRDAEAAACAAARAARAVRDAEAAACAAARAARDAEAAARAAEAAARAAEAARAVEAAGAAARAACAAARAAISDLAIAALDGVLRIGKQAEPIDVSRIEAANRSFELAPYMASMGQC